MKKNVKKSKTYAQKITQKRRESIRDLIYWAISTHDRFSGAYFWTPPQSASMRRAYERDNRGNCSFNYDGKEYKYTYGVGCSCKNVYYDGGFFVDCEQKDVRAFKKVLKELEAAIEAYNAKNQKVA